MSPLLKFPFSSPLAGLCLCLFLAVPTASRATGVPELIPFVAVPLADSAGDGEPLRLVPEPGIFILIATAGLLFIIRRR